MEYLYYRCSERSLQAAPELDKREEERATIKRPLHVVAGHVISLWRRQRREYCVRCLTIIETTKQLGGTNAHLLAHGVCFIPLPDDDDDDNDDDDADHKEAVEDAMMSAEPRVLRLGLVPQISAGPSLVRPCIFGFPSLTLPRRRWSGCRHL